MRIILQRAELFSIPLHGVLCEHSRLQAPHSDLQSPAAVMAFLPLSHPTGPTPVLLPHPGPPVFAVAV